MIMDFIRSQEQVGRSVESVCRVLRQQGLQVAARTYRAAKAGYASLSAGLVAMAYLMNAIHTLAYRVDHATGAFRLAPEGLYGRRKMTALLARLGQPVGPDAVAGYASYDRVHRAMSLLRHNGIRRAKRKRQRTDRGDGRRAGDLLGRDFTAPAPNITWVTDFTYVHTHAGWVYVAFVIDCFSHRILSWSAATSKTTDLVMDAVRMAVATRVREGHPYQRDQLIHHSDAGSQYTSIRLTEHLLTEGILPSIGTVGDAYDNALAETNMGLYKSECIETDIFHDGPWRGLGDVEAGTAAWVTWYNHDRLHGTLSMVPPIEYETAHYATHTPTQTGA